MKSLLDGLKQGVANTEMRDEEVLALSIERPSLFEVLVGRYQEAFIRKVLRVVRNREEAEDIVQDTFTKIYVNASKYRVRENASFKSWAYRILLNTAFTRYKKLRRETEFRVIFDSEIFEIIPDAENLAYDKESVKDEVLATLAQMPGKLKRSLEGYYLEDRSQKDIATEEGVSVGVIKVRVSRAKKFFKNILINNGVV